ncbi:MAG: hypothetical protein GKS00_29770 [Alphaproteobacteria bacterium]|nr:hypothetical protein [Alphaproteobacteria bacterium]
MGDDWQFQVRINLDDARAEAARRDPGDPSLQPLAAVLAKHNATLSCQYDAFAGYVAQAEQDGIEKYPLYAWTKATIEEPAKKAKYLKAFTLYVDGDEVYDREKADPLEADLQPLIEDKLIEKLSKHDTNPANNPQAPKKYRQ